MSDYAYVGLSTSGAEMSFFESKSCRQASKSRGGMRGGLLFKIKVVADAKLGKQLSFFRTYAFTLLALF